MIKINDFIISTKIRRDIETEEEIENENRNERKNRKNRKEKRSGNKRAGDLEKKRKRERN